MNKPKNTMKVSFPSRGANEGLARMLIAAFVTEADPTFDSGGGAGARWCRSLRGR